MESLRFYIKIENEIIIMLFEAVSSLLREIRRKYEPGMIIRFK